MLHPSYTDLMKVVNKDVEEGETKVVNSRYSIVMATSKRARQIIGGEMPLVDAKEGAKPLSVAIEELREGKLKILAENAELYAEAADAEIGEEADAENAEAAGAETGEEAGIGTEEDLGGTSAEADFGEANPDEEVDASREDVEADVEETDADAEESPGAGTGTEEDSEEAEDGSHGDGEIEAAGPEKNSGALEE